MITHWHTETYRVPRKWLGTRVRTRVLNADGKVMIDDLDPTVGAAIVAEHNHVLNAFIELRVEADEQSPQEPLRAPDDLGGSPGTRSG